MKIICIFQLLNFGFGIYILSKYNVHSVVILTFVYNLFYGILALLNILLTHYKNKLIYYPSLKKMLIICFMCSLTLNLLLTIYFNLPNELIPKIFYLINYTFLCLVFLLTIIRLTIFCIKYHQAEPSPQNGQLKELPPLPMAQQLQGQPQIEQSVQELPVQETQIEISLPKTAIFIAPECQVCIDKKPNIIFDCGHSLCEGCFNEIDNICPFCRKRIENTKKLIS